MVLQVDHGELSPMSINLEITEFSDFHFSSENCGKHGESRSKLDESKCTLPRSDGVDLLRW
jgi:hypothetical protein